jgi:hypothetical protein
MTVIYSDNTESLGEDWGELARARWPAARYFSEPTSDSYDAEQLHRDVSTLPRMVQALDRRDTEWRAPRAWSAQELFDAVTDPAGFAAKYHPSAAEALATLERLEATLGADGRINDCTTPGHPAPTLTLAALRVRIEQLADAATSTQQRAASKAGRRVA